MSSNVADTIEGFNMQLDTITKHKTQYPNQEFLVSLACFNSEVDFVLSKEPICHVSKLSSINYNPKGSTSLLDAIGMSIQRIERQLGAIIENDEASVVFIILTDGYENSSRVFRYAEIARMIQKLENTNNWTFIFLGADIDAFSISEHINIKKHNVVPFEKQAMSSAYLDVSRFIDDYANRKSSGVKRNNFHKGNENK